MADFEKIENEYELEKMYKVGWTSGQKFFAKLVMIGSYIFHINFSYSLFLNQLLLLLKGTKELCEIQLDLLLKIVHQSWQSKKTNNQIAITSQLEELESQKNFENKILQDNVSQLEARL